MLWRSMYEKKKFRVKFFSRGVATLPVTDRQLNHRNKFIVNWTEYFPDDHLQVRKLYL